MNQTKNEYRFNQWIEPKKNIVSTKHILVISFSHAFVAEIKNWPMSRSYKSLSKGITSTTKLEEKPVFWIIPAENYKIDWGVLRL